MLPIRWLPQTAAYKVWSKRELIIALQHCALHGVHSLPSSLIFGENITTHMAREIRDELLAATKKHNLKPEIGKWAQRTFGHDDDLAVNCQAFRNFIFTNGYNATVLIELMFGNVKNNIEYKLKHGCLWSVLERVFFFVDKRIDKIVKNLQKVALHGQFMNCDPEKLPKPGRVRESSLRQSTKGEDCALHATTVPPDILSVRWTNEINKIAACSIKTQSTAFALVMEAVRVDRCVLCQVVGAACIGTHSTHTLFQRFSRTIRDQGSLC